MSWRVVSQLLPEPRPVEPYVHPSNYREEEDVRIYSDDMHKAYSPNLCTLAIAVLTLGLYISIPHVMMGLFVGAFFSRTALCVLALLLATLLIPAKPLRVPAVLSSYMFLCWRRYFKFSYLFEVNLDSYQDYVIAQFPHGAFPIGAVLGGSFMATRFPEYPCYALAANAAFWVPLWRHVHAWLGTEACTKTNFHHLLSLGAKGPLLRHTHHHSSHKAKGAAAAAACSCAGGSGDSCGSCNNSAPHQQQQELHSDCSAAAAGAGGAGSRDQQQHQQQQQRTAAGGGVVKPNPFASNTSLAKAAAAGGVSATVAAGAAMTAAPQRLLGPWASAAAFFTHTPSTLGGCAAAAAANNSLGISGCNRPPAGATPAHNQQQQQHGGGGGIRHTSSAPLGVCLSAALSLRSSLFKLAGGGHHTLSDSDSSESECESDGGAAAAAGLGRRLGRQQRLQGSSGDREVCCACGSGLRCKDAQHCGAANGNSPPTEAGQNIPGRGYSSDGGSSSSSSRDSSCSGASMCSCCGAEVITVLAEVHSLPMDAFDRKQHQQQLLAIPPSSGQLDGAVRVVAAEGAAAVELDDDLDKTNNDSSSKGGDDDDVDSCGGCSEELPLLQQHHLAPLERPSSPSGCCEEQQLSAADGAIAGATQPPSTTQQRDVVDPAAAAATGHPMRKLGASVALMVGGIAEMFMIRRDHERIKLRDRKGFIRISLEHGVDILPVYMFGVNQALDFGPPWLQRVSRRMRASLGVIYGAWGLPIPRRVPIFMVTGRPLPVGPAMRKGDPRFAARVDELHAQFCVEIERLYYTHRTKYGHGFENRPLVIC